MNSMFHNPLAGEHPEIAEQAIREHIATGGSTYDPRSGASLAGARGFAASLVPEGSSVHASAPTAQDYAGFVAQHRGILTRNQNSAVGTFHDPETDLHHMEVVAVSPSKNATMGAASQLGEKSIYHLATDTVHLVPASGDYPHHLSLDERFQQVAAGSPRRSAYSGVHFSDAKMDVIDGNRRGSSGVGEESARLLLGSNTGMGKDAPPGFYSYAAGSLPESAISQRKEAHRVRGQFAFATTDHPAFQQGYAEGSQNAAAMGADPKTAHGIGLNHAEHALQDEGFDGYFSERAPHVRFHFGSHALETDAAKKPVK